MRVRPAGTAEVLDSDGNTLSYDIGAADGSYQVLSAEHVFKDYQFSVNNEIALPPKGSNTMSPASV